MTPHDRTLSASTLAPLLLNAAVGIVIVAQAWNVVPIAGAIALAGWGTALGLGARPGRFLLAAIVYVPLVMLAIGAELDAASTSTWRQFFTAVDSGAAGALMFLLVRRV
jgi:hypothetical protein